MRGRDDTSTQSGEALLGRQAAIDALAARLGAGQQLVLHGPAGIGKTAVLAVLGRQLAVAGRRVGRARQLGGVADLTAALAQAFPEVQAPGARLLRRRLRAAAEVEPPVLLLDHLRTLTGATQALLRELRGSGTGVVIAADTDSPRPRQQLRAVGLGQHEIALGPLARRHMRALAERWLAHHALPAALRPADRVNLIRLAAGRPGLLAVLITCAAERRYWQHGRLLARLALLDGTARLLAR